MEMNELVYLNEEEYREILNGLEFIDVAVYEERPNPTWSARTKLEKAHDEGLLMSFDVKKAKVRRVR